MAALMRGRRFRLICNVVDGLPRASHYGAAVASDIEVAESLGTIQQSDWRPPLTEWSLTEELLSAVLDRMADVVQIQSEKKLDYRPYPRPATAVDVLRERERRRKRERVRELFKPADG